jgi:hypothetical protein
MAVPPARLRVHTPVSHEATGSADFLCDAPSLADDVSQQPGELVVVSIHMKQPVLL